MAQVVAESEAYAASPRYRKRIEEIFGWGKTNGRLGQIKVRGLAKVKAVVTFTVTVYNLIRLPKAAPFKRNDQMLEIPPIGVMIFPGTGIQDNFADKARKRGLPVVKFGNGGA